MASPHLCLVCNVDCTSPEWLLSHIAGKKHARKVARAAKPASTPKAPVPPPSTKSIHCPVCSSVIKGGPQGWQGHTNGNAHKKRVAQVPDFVSPDYEVLAALPLPEKNQHCGPCNRTIARLDWNAHVQGAKHLKKVKAVPVPPVTSSANQSRNTQPPIPTHSQPVPAQNVPTPVVDLGFLDIDTISVKKTLTGTMFISPGKSEDVRFIEAKLLSMTALKHFELAPLPSQVVEASKSLEVQITFKSKNHRGRYTEPVEFTFEDATGSNIFKVLHSVRAVVGKREDLEQLRPESTYVRPQKRSFRRGKRRGLLISGERSPHLDVIPWVAKLKPFPILKEIEAIFESETPNFRAEFDAVRNCLPQILNVETYETAWKILLSVEELRMIDDLHQYDMEAAPLERHGTYYHLKVPGLAEKRPSVLIGDAFIVTVHGSSDSYEGFVHYIHEKQVALKFAKSFKYTPGQLCNIEFQLNRIVFRRMYHALSIAFKREDSIRLLFPNSSHFVAVKPITSKQTKAIEPHIFNKLILDNPRQLLAVTAIKERPPGSPPPGTGKTITAVEGIRQILLKDPNARILACAPSNAAADIIAQRLKDLGSETIVRLNAPSRPRSLLPEDLVPFSCIVSLESKYPSAAPLRNKQNEAYEVFGCPTKQNLMAFKVVVSTCYQSCVPNGIGVPRGHFTHIFIDEAGQGLEPEIMVPIKTMADSKTNIVLCGDPKQLGPIVHSEIAKQFFYGRSYLLRLAESEAYSRRDALDGIAMIRLNHNFRSHPAILKFPNERFYDGELKTFGHPDVINSLCKWSQLPKKDFPVIFHAIKGQNLREASSPSYFNPDEASVVKHYVEILRSDQSLGLETSDFGIISPYNAQGQKIRLLLNNKSQQIKYKVGSVEQFQGDENKIIIVSTVRSDHVLAGTYDKKHNLGFISQEPRFNVAVTRAKALLIVIGDPSVLSLDPMWRSFLNYVYLRGGWAGTDIEWDPNESGSDGPDDPDAGAPSTAYNFRNKVANEGGDDSEAVDRPWLRSGE